MARGKKNKAVIHSFIILITGFLSMGFDEQPVWSKLARGLAESKVHSLILSPSESSLYIGTNHAVYKLSPSAEYARPVLTLTDRDNQVNFFYIPEREPSGIYAATDDGVYLSRDHGLKWEKAAYGLDRESRECLSIARVQSSLYLGTRKGLYRRGTQDASWQKLPNELANSAVYSLYGNGDNLFIATGHEVFRLAHPSQKLEKVFSLSQSEVNGFSEEFELENGELEAASQKIKVLAGFSSSVIAKSEVMKQSDEIADPSRARNDSELCLASTQGVFCSGNHGNTWQKLSSVGLPAQSLTSLALVRNENQDTRIFAGSKEGVFLYQKERWQAAYQGMETDKINFLAADGAGGIYAATENGVYTTVIARIPTGRETKQSDNGLLSFARNDDRDHSPVHNGIESVPSAFSAGYESYQKLQENFQAEPSIQEVHRLAIQYADVNPGKIKEWKAQAKQRALLPALSVGLDRSATDLFHWDTGGSPDTLLKGRDYLEWDVSLSWDLADFIWSTDQTSIDSRSKLMVELREDILDQITRLYYERRRIQSELITFPGMDSPAKFDKNMRVEELTALIDALTGGKFSEKIKAKETE